MINGFPILRQIILILLSALSLAASVINENLFLLTWVGLVPFLFSLEGVSFKRAYGLGAVLGYLFFAISSFWIIEFLQKSSELKLAYCVLLASIYWFYCAQLFALLACLIVGLARWRPQSQWFSLALCGSLLFVALPVVFPADLSITQGKFLLALQAVDITGAEGLHFAILLHNGLVFALLRKRFTAVDPYQYAALGFILAWFIYGFFAYRYWSAEEQQWPSMKLGLVQPHSPPSVKIPLPEKGYSRAYPLEMELSLALASEEVKLIIWPEARYVGFYNEKHVREAFTHHANIAGVALLIQDLQNRGDETFNTSALIDSQGIQEYQKRMRIPFGEYLPLADVPILGDAIKKLFGNFYTPLAEGAPGKPMIFNPLTMQSLICFDVVHPRYVAGLVYAAAEQKHAVQLLVTQSNDSWFGTSIQPYLHLTSSRLRSLEQRLPLVHALNNGPSSVFSASGNITAVMPAYERATAVAKLAYPIDPSLTWFGRFPYGFIFFVLLLTFLWVLAPFARASYISSRGTKSSGSSLS
ncbi:MAG: apolipoprotein N-acyltransferase [Pseudomonadota bacterium]